MPSGARRLHKKLAAAVGGGPADADGEAVRPDRLPRIQPYAIPGSRRVM